MNNNYEKFRKEHIKSIEVLGSNNRVVEIRMLKTKNGIVSGYYNDNEKLLRDIFRHDGVNNNFFTLKSFEKDLLAREKNSLIKLS